MKFLAAGFAVGVRARLRLLEANVRLSAAEAEIFLLAFARTANLDNRATPGMRNDVIWLIPLNIPVFQRAPAATAPPQH